MKIYKASLKKKL